EGSEVEGSEVEGSEVEGSEVEGSGSLNSGGFDYAQPPGRCLSVVEGSEVGEAFCRLSFFYKVSYNCAA
ncbi:MAG: hypothetical protein LWX70_11895, partial [Sphingobacteriia bacterium]|nr:hypothetical protein [Sphingobacteriia bacterium]